MPKQKDGLYKIENAEIFRTGHIRGIDYTEKDIDQMIETVKALGHLPPLKDGHHDEKEGWPALGFVTNLRRKGNVLIADFSDMPKVVYDAIKNRRYDRVSIEFMARLMDNGKKIHKMFLRAVSILGAELPQIKELQPLRTATFAEDDVCDTKLEFDSDIKLAEWDAAFINDLPDAAFAVIQSGGEKDDDGKTIPRSLRKLPHHNASVTSPTDNDSIDMPHLRNALSRLSQTDITDEEKEKARSHLQRHMMTAQRENMGEDVLQCFASEHGAAFVVGKLRSGGEGLASVVFSERFWTVPGGKRWLSDRGVQVGMVSINKKTKTFTISSTRSSS